VAKREEEESYENIEIENIHELSVPKTESNVCGGSLRRNSKKLTENNEENERRRKYETRLIWQWRRARKRKSV